MSFFKKLADFFTSAGAPPQDEYWVNVQCNRCGETIKGRVNLNNDLSLLDEEGESSGRYYCRKVLIGEKRCFQPIEVELTFDKDRHLLEKKITGGKFIIEEE